MPSLSVSETADVIELNHTNICGVQREWYEKEKGLQKNMSECTTCWLQTEADGLHQFSWQVNMLVINLQQCFAFTASY